MLVWYVICAGTDHGMGKILLCGGLWANKVPGIRTALCHDAETAQGTRWNHANVLALSLRATPEPIVKEILDRWFGTPFSDDEWNLRQMARLREIEKREK